MESNSITKSPRLYTELDLKSGEAVSLEGGQAHYLKNVLRKNPGDPLRLFNGRDGEWVGEIQTLSKKAVTAKLTEQSLAQPTPARRIHLYFAPIKKNRMDFLIEKAVELGATDLHPVITQNTENRKMNIERTQAQIIEAAEQCERLELPLLHAPSELFKALGQEQAPLLAALERGNHPEASDIATKYTESDIALLVGPEGGFTELELERIAGLQNVEKTSLGETILRAETAALKFLCAI